MTVGWESRAGRAAVFAAVCVLLAAPGHVMMSGSPVPGWLLLVAVLATGATTWCLTDRERGLPLIVTLAVGAQSVLHTSFSLAQGSAPGAPHPHMPMSAHSTGMSMSMGRDMDTAMGAGSPDIGPLDHLLPAPFGTASLAMLAAHLLAALLCGLRLAHGERAVFRILRALAARLVVPLRLLLPVPAPPHRPRVRVRRDHTVLRPRELLLVHASTSRGPPAGTAVV